MHLLYLGIQRAALLAQAGLLFEQRGKLREALHRVLQFGLGLRAAGQLVAQAGSLVLAAVKLALEGAQFVFQAILQVAALLVQGIVARAQFVEALKLAARCV
jgi:hypothetical protein